jgi:hypothetical protein
VKWYNKITQKQWLLISLGILMVAGLIEYFMGRIFMCKCGYIKFWHGVVFSSENSQHLTDWYTFSHIIHGFGFYFILWLVDRKKKLPWGLKLAVAMLLEAAWEVTENTPMVINHYRAVTISLDYFGDSIINSMFDILAMAIGFVLAWKWPVWLTVTAAILMELIVGYFIRDNLTLNIIMLLHPVESIKIWQMGK